MRRDRESEREGKTSEVILIQRHRSGRSASIDGCVSKICRLIQQLMPFSGYWRFCPVNISNDFWEGGLPALGLKTPVIRSTQRAAFSTRRSIFACMEYAPVFQLALRDRSNPSELRGPVLAPPCILQRPFGMAGLLQDVPSRVLAPHRIARLKSPGGLSFFSQPCPQCMGFIVRIAICVLLLGAILAWFEIRRWEEFEMRGVARVLFVFALFLATVSDARAEHELKRLQTACLISDLSGDAEKLGLTEEIVTSSVFVALKRDLPKLEVHRKCNNTEDGLIGISVAAMTVRNKSGGLVGHATHVSLSLRRNAMILSGQDLQTIGVTFAQVWNTDTLLVGKEDFAQQVIEVLKEFGIKFSAAYYRDN
jgi:hypothetical protein